MTTLDWDDFVITHDTEALNQGGQYVNLELVARMAANSDLLLAWGPAEDIVYTRGVHFSFLMHQQCMKPMVTRFYPGYQETIYGDEGVVLSQRVFVPYRAGYQRSVCWLLEVQAEGAQLIRVDVDLYWPEDQNVVQQNQRGLLLAQVAPSVPKGLSGERQAHATVVFGTEGGAPTEIEFLSPYHARLTYYVLVDGYVDLPFVATFSDAGETMAWNGFLANQEITSLWNESNEQLSQVLQAGRIYSPDATFNRQQLWATAFLLRTARRHRQGPLPGGDVGQTIDVAASLRLLPALDFSVPQYCAGALQTLARRAIVQGQIASRLDGFSGNAELVLPADPALNLAFLTACHHHYAVTGELLERHFREPIRAVAQTLWSQVDTGASAVLSNAWNEVVSLLTVVGEEDLVRQIENRTHQVSDYTPSPAVDPILPTDSLLAEVVPWSWLDTQSLHVVINRIRTAWERLVGLRYGPDDLELRPDLPAAWRWLIAEGVPWHSQRMPLLFYDGTIHAQRLIPAVWPVHVWDEIRPLAGAPSAWHLKRSDGEALFVASDHDWQGAVRVGTVNYRLQLRAGDAQWLDL